jgi:nucleoside-diphosphate-sugar epimerase
LGNNRLKNILVTGVAGYIGSVLVRQLLDKEYFVRGLDILNFGGESLLGIYNHPNFEFIKGDVRKESDLKIALNDIDAVVHLAAIVGDPACAKQPEIAKETNWLASKKIFELCNASLNIKRFIFASTCSNYGKMEGNSFVTENSPLKPVSLYAELKVKFEKYILEAEVRPDFSPTSLRFSTVYGISPRIRFDLTVNEFIRDVTFGKELKIFGEQFWRPYCHVEDLAKSCVTVLESELDKVKQQVFNVGDTTENYQKKMIADEILKIVHDAKITYVHKDEDPRDYRVNFQKIKDNLNFEITKTVPMGLKEIYNLLKDNILTNPYSELYKNI